MTRRTPVVKTAGKVPTDIEVTVKDLGGVRIVALMHDPQTTISELGPTEHQSNEGFEKPVDVELNANVPGGEQVFVYYDMRAGRKLGTAQTVKVRVVPFEPVILSVWPKDAGEFSCAAPTTIKRGDPLNMRVRPGSSQAEEYVYNVEVTAPDGKNRLEYRANLAFDADGGQIHVPLALNDATGSWTIAIREALTGRTKKAAVQVDP